MNAQTKKALVRKAVSSVSAQAIELSDAIADFAEPGYEEFKSANAMAEYLKGHGFKLQWPWKYIPTAFKATWGKDGASIGFLAEYDALPDCGVKKGAFGHGCGHNLLGAAAATAAVAASKVIAKRKLRGQIVLWGTPAEELTGGKVYMAANGAFRNCDATVGWHPSYDNKAFRPGGAAVDSMLYEFFGKTAHGASAHEGRSALDGVMLMDVAANYLREHVPENSRIHMCVRDGGGAPNVVPGYAKSWYYVRGKDRQEVDELRTRLNSCAKGAAVATGTRVRIKRLSGVYHRLRNETMGDTVLENLKLFGAPRASTADRRNVKMLGKKPVFDEKITTEWGEQPRGSTDEDNVSWLSPLGILYVATSSIEGVPYHHTDLTRQMKLPYAHKAMLRAAEIMAGVGVDLCSNNKLLAKVKAEFKRNRKGKQYDPLVPKGKAPPPANP